MFISFPPKYSPYAGHQQVSIKKLVKLLYLHLLLDKLYDLYLNIMGLKVSSRQGLMDTKHNRLSILDFEKLVPSLNLNILKSEFYIIHPCFESRFNMHRLKNPFSGNSKLREIITMGALYCLIK